MTDTASQHRTTRTHARRHDCPLRPCPGPEASTDTRAAVIP